MKVKATAVLTVALLAGCVATIKEAYVPAEGMNVAWLGRTADKVGVAAVSGDGQVDGHFRVELDLGETQTVESIGIFQTDASGVNHFGHGVWHTSSSAGLNWIVGVFKDGEQLNKGHTESIGQFGGRSAFDLYISENEWIRHLQNGHHFVVEVAHGGKTSTKLITLGERTPLSSAASTQAPAVDEEALKRAEEARLAQQKQYRDFYAAAMEKAAASEAKGDFREAAKLYQQAVSVARNLTGTTEETTAREKVIGSVRKLSVPPAIPEEARRRAIRGETVMRTAKKLSDFKRAASEFSEASVITPWWGSVYYNLGLAREAAKDAKGAITAFNLFLKAEPDAPEAKSIRDRLYALEIPAEEQEKKKAYTGIWKSDSGSILKGEFADDRFKFTEVAPSASARGYGYYVGQVVFDGTWDGTQVVGKTQASHSGDGTHPQFKKCFGNFGAYNSTMKLGSKNELVLTYDDHWITQFNTNTCEVLQRQPVNTRHTYVR